jgi:hypothetical protein
MKRQNTLQQEPRRHTSEHERAGGNTDRHVADTDPATPD